MRISEFQICSQDPDAHCGDVFHRLDSKRATIFVALAFGAFALRSVWLFRAGSVWAMQQPDSTQYLELAQGFLHGCGFARWSQGVCYARETFRTPVYPAMIAMFGGRWRWVLATQAVMGASLTLMVALFTFYRFGVRAAIFAEAVVAADVPSILATKEVITEGLFQTLLGCSVLMILASATSSNSDRTAAVRTSFGGGLLAAATLVRPVGEVLLPFLWLPFFFSATLTTRRRLVLIGLTTLAAASPLCCWSARNRIETKVWTLSTVSQWNFFYYAAPGVLHAAGQGDLEIIRRDLALRLATALQSSSVAQGYYGGDKSPTPEVLREALEIEPRLGSLMYRPYRKAVWDYPFIAAKLCFVGFFHLAMLPYLPGVGFRGLLRGESGPSVLPLSRNAGLIFRLVILTAIIFQSMLLIWVWCGVLLAQLAAWRLGFCPYTTIVITLTIYAMILLAVASPFFDNWDLRFRTPAIPFLAIVGSLGWLSFIEPQYEQSND
jgi:hypothetical protein